MEKVMFCILISTVADLFGRNLRRQLSLVQMTQVRRRVTGYW